MAEDYFKMGYDADKEGKYEDAVKYYTLHLNSNPRDEKAWYGKGSALNDLGKHEDAIKCYDKALEINPKYADAWYNKGLALDDLGKHEDAIKCYDKALEINPNDAILWCLKGVALEGLGEFQKEIECLDKALEINPKDEKILNYKGGVFDYLGKYEESIKCYDKALEINPKDEKALNNKRFALEQLKETAKKIVTAQNYENALRYEDAIKIYKELNMNDKIKEVKLIQAKQFEEIGKYEESAKIYEELNRWEDAGRVRKLALMPKEKIKIEEHEKKEEEQNKFSSIKILRDFSYRSRDIKFSVKVSNNSDSAIRSVRVILDLPPTLKPKEPQPNPQMPTQTEKIIGDIEAEESLATDFLLKPLACTTAKVRGWILFKDSKGKPYSKDMEPKDVETCKPNAEPQICNFSEFKEMLNSKEWFKGTDNFEFSHVSKEELRNFVEKTGEWLNLYKVEDCPEEDTIVFTGKQKIEKKSIIAVATILQSQVKIRCHAEAEKIVSGFLTEFSERLNEIVLQSKPFSRETVERIQDLFEEINDSLLANNKKKTVILLNKFYQIIEKIEPKISLGLKEYLNKIYAKDNLEKYDKEELKMLIDEWNEIVRRRM